MRWYDKIIASHTAVLPDISHYERMKSSRYLVWQEYDRDDLVAESAHRERVVIGTTDLFTKTEFDEAAEALEASMTAHGIAWEKTSVQYEDETGFIHHEWTWEVTDGKSDG